ncbi:MAG: hypothetical protein HYW86_01430 [Candidatus Roizmanbacteria bacterium]|nr:MAG: hypothetical protein HYW86_01430 [Candidatus Roizmanbacteria bacterium]
MNKVKYSSGFFIILFLAIVGSFLIFQPKLSTWLFSFKRQSIFNNFMADVQKNKAINARTFWEFREFFNPGYFTFERDGLSKKQTAEALKKVRISLNSNVYYHPFLIYNSDKLNSIEFLVQTNELNKIINNVNDLTLNVKKEILNTPSSHLYYDSDKTVKILFIKPVDEMVLANGFYNYRNDEDVKIYKDKSWLSITSVNLK